jgi:HD-like signal output (HDOD) protein
MVAMSAAQRLRVRISPLENAVKQAASRALDDDDVTGLLAVLQIDPLTAARYLRVANSPLFGRKHGVGSTIEAMDVLGRRASAMIALVSSFDYGFSSRRRDDRLELARRHSLQTAVLAQQMATCAGLAWHAEELFVAGLLHDIAGMLRSVANESTDSHASPADSARCSADLLHSWHLPRLIVGAIAEQAQAEGSGRPPAPGPGRALWVAHQFTALVTERGEPGVDELRALAVLLDAPTSAVVVALHAARDRYQQFERSFQ